MLKYTIDGQVCYTEQLPAGATITAIAEPIKKGHTFSGWSNMPSLMPAKNLDITGTFSVNNYHLVYKVEDKVIHEEDVPYGSILTPPVGEVREGHTLTWSNLPSAMPDSDITVNGFYSVNKYKLTYILDGKVNDVMDVTYGTPITPKVVDEREGYTFSGWSEVPATMPAKDVIITGSFVANKYTLTYIVDGEAYQSNSVDYGTKLTAIAFPTKEGHTFSGWSEFPATMPAKDVTVSGTFIINKYLVTFKIGDEVIASDSLTYGAAIVTPEAPEKEGYTFNGWGEVPETVPAEDIIFYGGYTANVYKVYYFVGATLVSIVEVAYGETIPEYIYEPTDEDEVFMGWIGDAYETMPAHDVTYTANLANGIEYSAQDAQYSIIYDIVGRRITDIENMKGGIYIINGKKVLK